MRALRAERTGRADHRQGRLLLPRANAYPNADARSHSNPHSNFVAYSNPLADSDPIPYANAVADPNANLHSHADARAPHHLRLAVGEPGRAVRGRPRHIDGERLRHAVQPPADLHLPEASPQRRMAVLHLALRRHAGRLPILRRVAFLPRDRHASRVRGDRRLQPGHRHVEDSPHRDAYPDFHPNADAYRDCDSYAHGHPNPDRNADSHSHAYPNADRDAHLNSDGDAHAYGYSHTHAYPNSNSYADSDPRQFSNVLLERDRRPQPVKQSRTGQ